MSRRLSSSLRVPSREGIRWRTSQAAEAIAFAYREARETLRTMLPGRRTGGRRNGHEISAVVVGRNDGYIPDFLECLSGTVRLNAIRGCLREVIFVEWAPPTDAPLLAPELCDRFPFLRSFVVPEEIQRAKWNSTGDGFLEYHAKNVGIRRATSPWVIVTNADILFGGDTSRFLRRLKSHPIRVGIAKRYDVSWRVGESRLAGRVRYHRAIPSHPRGTGDFVLAHRDLWWRARGYDEGIPELRAGCDRRGVAQLKAQGGVPEEVGSVLHTRHETSMIEGAKARKLEFADDRGIPYRNPDSWGLADCTVEQIHPRVDRLRLD